MVCMVRRYDRKIEKTIDTFYKDIEQDYITITIKSLFNRKFNYVYLCNQYNRAESVALSFNILFEGGFGDTRDAHIWNAEVFIRSGGGS